MEVVKYMSLKIGLFNDSFPPTIDGVANTVVNYATVLSKKGCDITVATPKYPHVTDNYPFDVYRYPSINLEKRIGYRAGTPSPIAVADLMAKNMDIVHVHSPFASSVMAKAVCARPHRPPVVFTYHTKFDVDIDARVKINSIRKIAKKFVLSNIRAADEVWVVTETAAQSLRSFGYSGEYRVMENGTDFPKGKSSKENIDELNRALRITDDGLVFLFVGRMQWYKNIKLIIDSLREIKQAGIEFKMIFVGDGKDRPAIEQYINNSGLSDRLLCVGAIYDRERIRTFFSRADLFLFPSTYDTSGLVVKEAAACACPSLLVKGSAAAEGVQHGLSGILAEENEQSCARAIIDSVRSGKLSEYGENAQKYVYLSWDDAVGRAYKRYEEILESWPRKFRI